MSSFSWTKLNLDPPWRNVENEECRNDSALQRNDIWKLNESLLWKKKVRSQLQVWVLWQNAFKMDTERTPHKMPLWWSHKNLMSQSCFLGVCFQKKTWFSPRPPRWEIDPIWLLFFWQIGWFKTTRPSRGLFLQPSFAASGRLSQALHSTCTNGMKSIQGSVFWMAPEALFEPKNGVSGKREKRSRCFFCGEVYVLFGLN